MDWVAIPTTSYHMGGGNAYPPKVHNILGFFGKPTLKKPCLLAEKSYLFSNKKEDNNGNTSITLTNNKQTRCSQYCSTISSVTHSLIN